MGLSYPLSGLPDPLLAMQKALHTGPFALVALIPRQRRGTMVRRHSDVITVLSQLRGKASYDSAEYDSGMLVLSRALAF